MTTSRERVTMALNHQQPDRTPLDVGATSVTGIAASALHRLRQALRLPQRTVTVHEPYQMLGRVDDDVLDALGIDVIGLWDGGTLFGWLPGRRLAAVHPVRRHTGAGARAVQH